MFLKSKYISILFTFILMVSSSCNSHDGDTLDYIDNKEVVVLFSPAGLGDLGYNDMIFQGISSFKQSHPNVWLQSYSPSNLKDAKEKFLSWLENEQTKTTLFILAGSDYEPLVDSILKIEKYRKAITAEKDLLLFESNNDSLPIHTFNISMYGVSYLCGIFAQQIGCSSPSIILANSIDKNTWVSAKGFSAAWENKPTINYLSDDWKGYASASKAYELSNEMESQYDFIFSVAGGSNLGIYRYLRENPGQFLTAGMDTDQSYLSSSIIGSVIKRIDLVVYDYLNLWISNRTLPHHTSYGLESEYINWQPSYAFSKFSYTLTEDIYRKAISLENEYIDSK